MVVDYCYTVVLFVLLLLGVCGCFGFCLVFGSLILWILGLLGWLHVFLLVFVSLGCAGYSAGWLFWVCRCFGADGE